MSKHCRQEISRSFVKAERQEIQLTTPLLWITREIVHHKYNGSLRSPSFVKTNETGDFA